MDNTICNSLPHYKHMSYHVIIIIIWSDHNSCWCNEIDNVELLNTIMYMGPGETSVPESSKIDLFYPLVN